MSTETARKNVPTQVKVGPYRYTVGFDAEHAYDYAHSGVCLYRSRRVEMDPRQADTELPQTFLHEILHALGDAFEIADWVEHTTDADGKVIDKHNLMATALLLFIRQNPEVVAWLQKEAA